MSRPKPLILIILDGWGYRAETKANAIALARKPTYDRLLREYPNTLIHTSGPFVGLPEGQMGNSEVGHLNIGAGRIVHMDITRIDLMIRNGEFFQHPVLLDAMKHARTGERRLHLFGLVSDGGVHSQQAHLYALLKMAKQNGLERVFVHAFMDGRDTLPTNGAGYLEQLQQKMREYNCGRIATVNGRYYAMDRDRRWERIAKAYNAMVFADAEGGKYSDPVQGMKDSYNRGVTDEFVIPFVVEEAGERPAPHKRLAMRIRASASTSEPTAFGRLRERWRATADWMRWAAATCPAPPIWMQPFRATACRRICAMSA